MSFIWNTYARAYDVINQNIPYQKMLSDVIRELAIKPDDQILNVGCGTGNLEELISSQYPQARIIGIDSSDPMLKRAKSKLHNRAEFIKMDINKCFNFNEKFFSKIAVVNTLYTVHDTQSIIKDLYKLLHPGGRFVISDPLPSARLRKIFSAQRKEMGSVKYIISFFVNLPAILFIIIINLFLLSKKKNFFTAQQLEKVLGAYGFKEMQSGTTYADQNTLISAIK